MDSVDSLKKDLAKLKSVFDKNKKNVIKGDVTKPEEPKVKPADQKKSPFGKPQPNDDDDKEEDSEDKKDNTQPVFKKKNNTQKDNTQPVFKKKVNPLADKQEPEEE